MMSAPLPPARLSATAIVVCVTVAFVVSVTGSTVIAVLVEDPATLIGLVVAPLATFVPSLLILVKLGGQEERLDKVAADTTDLTNGVMDSKIRAAVSDVLHPNLIDPAAAEQLKRDHEVQTARLHAARRLLEPHATNGDPPADLD